MKWSNGMIFAAFAILTIVITGCASVLASTPTSTPAPIATSTPTTTSLPTPTSTPVPTDTPTTTPTPAITIETSEGRLAVTKVEVVDRFPPGCDPNGFGCSRAASGYIILIVWLEKVDETVSVDSVALISKPIYVTGADGSRTKIFAGGIHNGELFVAFTPPETASEFVLEWPDAPPVELGQ